MPAMTMVQALNSAMDVMLARDRDVVIFGEDVGFYGGVFRVTDGLQKKHGEERVFDAPIAEGGMLAVAVGMGAYGLRPVVEIQFADYIYPATDQLISEAARLRYARYVVARYSAFNVLFLLTSEWGPNPKPMDHDASIAMFNRIGTEIQNHDPHRRLRGIHDDNGCLPDDFYGNLSVWNTLGQYAQHSGSDYQWPWCDDCSPPNDANCKGRFATPRNRQTLHDEMLDVRVNRKRNRPVMDGEYAYYLRRAEAGHPMVVNRGHSQDQATFRKAAWVLTMAGTYIVPGFWRTYYGGWAGRNTPFRPDDPEALPAVKDLQTLHTFFTQLENGSRRLMVEARAPRQSRLQRAKPR